MRDRFNRLVVLVMALTMVAIGAYVSAVYTTASSADQAADIQNERVVHGLLEAKAERTLDLVERLAHSDQLFHALQKNQPNDMLDRFCGQSSETKLKTIGVLSVDLSMSYLCEYGEVKTASEQGYLMQFLQPYSESLLLKGKALIQKYGDLHSTFVFDQRYTSFSGETYILTIALVTPEKAKLNDSADLHIFFSMENIDKLLTQISDDFLNLELIDSGDAQDRLGEVHVANLKRSASDEGISIAWSRSESFRQHMWYLGPILLGVVIVAGVLMIQSLRHIQRLHTDLMKREARSRHEAQHDQMTGLLNRTSFYERLDDLLLKATDTAPVFVGIFDLDRFKSVNDNFGHHAGDMLIIETAHRLASVMRDENLVARLGGDEFAFAIRTCENFAAARLLLDRLLNELRRDVWVEGMLIQPSASIGCAIAPSDSISREILLKKADIALYEVKESGRGAVQFFGSTKTAGLADVTKKQPDHLVA